MAARALSGWNLTLLYTLTPLTRNLEWHVVQGASPTGQPRGQTSWLQPLPCEQLCDPGSRSISPCVHSG